MSTQDPEPQEPGPSADIEVKIGPAEAAVRSRGQSGGDQWVLIATFVVIGAVVIFAALTVWGHPWAATVALVLLLLLAAALAYRARQRGRSASRHRAND